MSPELMKFALDMLLTRTMIVLGGLVVLQSTALPQQFMQGLNDAIWELEEITADLYNTEQFGTQYVDTEGNVVERYNAAEYIRLGNALIEYLFSVTPME